MPFDLDSHLQDVDEQRIRWVHQNGQHELWDVQVPEDAEVKEYLLFLGVFGKGEIARICQKATGTGPPPNEYEDFERADLEGRTCFARLRLSRFAEPVIEAGSISVSTVPWALGQVSALGLSALSTAAFEQSRKRLMELLQNFVSRRQQPEPEGELQLPRPLTNAELLELHQIFCEWASYTPSGDNPVAALEIVIRKKKTKVHEAAELLPFEHPSGQSSSAASEDEEEDEPAIDILNSFFALDIERIQSALQSGRMPAALARYLTPLHENDRIDLDSDPGREAVLAALHPDRMPRGHWLTGPGHAMNLMQQFAISSAMHVSEEDALFSVNGPPGTGKTTFLRELIAANVVDRARRLADLENARAAFEPTKVSVTFAGDSRAIQTVQLRPELTGFEMVVASSNNAAVENLSRDLPRRKSLAHAWSSVTYLQPVAYKIAAQKTDGSIGHLPANEIPWGLISAALGRSANRYAFKERFAYNRVRDDAETAWPANDRPQTIWEWIDTYRGPGFREAVADFKAVEVQAEAYTAKLSEYSRLVENRIPGISAAALARANQQVSAAACDYHDAFARNEALRTERTDLLEQCNLLKREQRLIMQGSPPWWARLFRTKSTQLYRAQLRATEIAQQQLSLKMSELDRRLSEATEVLRKAGEKVADAHTELSRAESIVREEQIRWEAMTRELPHLQVPESLADLSQDNFQMNGLWNDETLTHLRSALFCAALRLHEAWLAEVGKRRAGFRPNIVAVCKLLSNKRPEDKAHAEQIWQSLFLMVPVVSTTFASLAGQFRDLEMGSIGWMFIDEAGQAVPQAAAGALWRAQRA